MYISCLLTYSKHLIWIPLKSDSFYKNVSEFSEVCKVLFLSDDRTIRINNFLIFITKKRLFNIFLVSRLDTWGTHLYCLLNIFGSPTSGTYFLTSLSLAL